MSIIKGKCDRCEKIFDGKDLEQDYDGNDLCPKCLLKDELVMKETELKEKDKWLKATYFKNITKLKEEIFNLRKEIGKLD